MVLGYTTGTFDFVHPGHFEMLKFCKQRCDTLIVGLTTDQLGQHQKRLPIMSFAQRKAILENSRWVDQVIEHRGEDKIEAYRRLKFDVCFIGDEYLNTKEYSSVEMELKGLVKMIFMPRTYISTSSLLHQLHYQLLRQVHILDIGTTGPLLQFQGYIVKPIAIGPKEYRNTRDVFHFGTDPPRNWKHLIQEESYPNVSGVNSNRELAIQHYIRQELWNPVLDIYRVYLNPSIDSMLEQRRRQSSPSKSTKLQKALHANDDRRYPVEIYWIIMRECGRPLNPEDVKDPEVKRQIDDFFVKLRNLGIVHGDIHCRNLLIDEHKKLSLIDFGWCTHASFQMSQEELKDHRHKLDHRWDETHFLDSLKH